MSRFKKYILISLISIIAFVVLVVIFVERDETGKVRLSFSGRKTNISADNFNEIIEGELNLSDINWSDAYNKVLEQRYSEEGLAQDFLIDTQDSQANNNQQPVNESVEKKEKAFQKFVNYLTESEVKLDEKKNPFQLALSYRDQDKPKEIDRLMAFYDSKIADLRKVTPPEEALGYHLVKLRLLREIRFSVNKIKESSKGESLEEVLAQEEINYLARLNLILKQYLAYFFSDKINV